MCDTFAPAAFVVLCITTCDIFDAAVNVIVAAFAAAVVVLCINM